MDPEEKQSWVEIPAYIMEDPERFGKTGVDDGTLSTSTGSMPPNTQSWSTAQALASGLAGV